MMKLHTLVSFHLAADIHGESECILFHHASFGDTILDINRYSWASKRYADQAHADCGNNGFMTSTVSADGFGNAFHEQFEVHGTGLDFCHSSGYAKSLEFQLSLCKMLDKK
jgi:hypothetical protein